MPTNKVKTAKAVYSFATDGGAVSTITPAINATIPKGAIILRSFTNVTTSMTSGGAATVAIAAAGVVVKAATAFDDSAYTGIDAQGVTPTLVATTGKITFTVATAALTAGVVEIIVEYVV